MKFYLCPGHKTSRNWSKPMKYHAFLFNLKLVFTTRWLLFATPDTPWSGIEQFLEGLIKFVHPRMQLMMSRGKSIPIDMFLRLEWFSSFIVKTFLKPQVTWTNFWSYPHTHRASCRQGVNKIRHNMNQRNFLFYKSLHSKFF